jgi:hypothetical protein
MKKNSLKREVPFDPTVLEQMSPLSALYFLSRQRLLSLFPLLEDDERFINSSEHFINPLLLASALSISRLKNHDFQSLLSDYMRGLHPDFEKYLLKVPEFENQEELEKFLDLEEKYVQALRLLPLLLMLPSITPTFVNRYRISGLTHWFKFLMLPELIPSQQDNQTGDPSPCSTKRDLLEPDPTPLLVKFWQELKACDRKKGTLDFNKFDVFYVAWVVFNPLYLRILDDKSELSLPDPSSSLWRDLAREGSAKNSLVHNARQYYNSEFGRLKGMLNSILKSNLPKEEKRVALIRIQRQIDNAARLAKRAYRFYSWLPHEIAAHKGDWVGVLATIWYARTFYGIEEAELVVPSEFLNQLVNYGE